MELKRTGFAGRFVGQGMRSIAGTTFNEHGFEPELIEVCLDSCGDEVRSAYNRADYVERRRPMMEWRSKHIRLAATGSLSVAAINESNERKAVLIR